ncbi:MAG: surfeit locus 1 family protein [Methylocystis sp.]|nr:MAG: surfeit locus 1 family protein [Methylocystis sp.]
MSRGARALLWPAIATLLGVALLVSLGSWQLRRLGEKEALIARIESRVHVPPQDFPPPGDWRAPADFDFAHVRARGRYVEGRDALIFMKAPDGFGPEPGYMVVTPFALLSGNTILVERGFIPASKADDLAGRAPPSGELTITGLMRAPQSRNMFTPSDDPARFIWYTRDPAAISAALGVASAAPFFTIALQSPQSAVPNGFPRLVSATPEIVNNHLSYAFTWFSLALALLVVFAVFARGRLKLGDAG